MIKSSTVNATFCSSHCNVKTIGIQIKNGIFSLVLSSEAGTYIKNYLVF